MRLYRLWRMAAAFVLAASVPAAANAGPLPMSGSIPPPRMVWTETDAFVLLPPELVAAPIVTQVLLSDSGRYLLAERTHMMITAEIVRAAQGREAPPPGDVSLVLWDSRARTSREVWTAPLAGTVIQQIAWLSHTEAAFALVRRNQGAENHTFLLRISGGTERVQAIPLLDPTGSAAFELHVSPKQPFALLQQTSMGAQVQPGPDGTPQEIARPQETLTPIDREGQPGHALAVPDGMRLGVLEWDEAGNAILSLTPAGPGKDHGIDHWYALDPQTAALRPLPAPPPIFSPKPLPNDDRPSPLRLKLDTIAAREGETSQSVGLLWLESVAKSEKPRALVCGDSTGGQLLPGGEGVLYFSQGAVWVAPLLRLTRAENQAMKESAQRAVAMSDARQVGLALIMYAQDNNDALPGAEELRSRLTPYLPKADLADGFVFTYLGDKIADLQNPRETELGYVSAPGGRAVLFADGHVTWKKAD